MVKKRETYFYYVVIKCVENVIILNLKTYLYQIENVQYVEKIVNSKYCQVCKLT